MSIETIKYKLLQWVDINNPTKIDKQTLESQFKFEEIDLKYAYASTFRAKVTPRKQYVFLVLVVPFLSSNEYEVNIKELDCFITKKELITVHDENITTVNELVMKLSASTKERDAAFKGGVEQVLLELLEGVLDHTDVIINQINDRLEKIKTDIFAESKSKSLVGETLRMRHAITELRKSVRGYLTILGHLKGRKGYEMFESLHDYATELWDELESNKELIEALEDANETLQTHSLNEILKTLTVFSSVTLPAAVVAGIFGMNAKYMPFVGNAVDFWLMLCVVMSASVLCLLIFAKKHWVR